MFCNFLHGAVAAARLNLESTVIFGYAVANIRSLTMTTDTSELERPAAKRPSRVKRRRDLLGVVYEAVSDNGIDGVGMREIAERAGVSTGTLNYHFKNKKQLIMAAMKAAYELPEDFTAHRTSALSQLKVFVFSAVFRGSKDRFWRFWINCASQATRDMELRDHQNERLERQQKFWGSLLKAASDTGEIGKIDAEKAAEELIILCHGLVVRQVLRPDKETRERARELIEEYFEELEGVTKKKNGK